MKRNAFLNVLISASLGVLLSVGLLAALPASSAWAAQAVLTWDPPTTNADGTPLTDLKGYKVYKGPSTRAYGTGTDVGNVTTYTVQGLAEGTWFFAVTAYDTAGNESVYSNEVSKSVTIPPTAPALKSSIIIIITP